jgi:hypothetical protein
MRPFIRATLFFFLSLTTAMTGLRAEDKQPGFDPAVRAKTIAPFIGEQTYAIVHVDLARIAAEPFLTLLLDMVPGAKEELSQGEIDRAIAVLAKLVHSGVKDLYLVMGTDDLFLGPADPQMMFAAGEFVVVPLAPGADANAISAVFRSAQVITDSYDGVLVAAAPATLQRLKKMKPETRPDLAAAFEAAGNTTAQALFIPPAYWRRVIEEMMPNLPAAIGGGPSSVYTRGVRWAALGVDPPLQLSLKLVVQSQDEQSAKALRQKSDALWQQIGRDQEVRRAVPKFEALQELLTPAVQGDRLVWSLDQKRVLAALRTIVRPALEDARQGARRTMSMNCLKQLAMAMVVYGSHHDDRLPPAASHDAQGKPLLSWRVHILPSLGQESLFKQFRLDEPWDSRHNRGLVDKMPAIFRSPASTLKEPGRTNYLVPAGKATLFPPGAEGVSTKQVKSPAATITIVEVDDQQAVVWTKPEDLPFDADHPLAGLGGLYKGGFHAAYVDGHVDFVPVDTPREKLRAAFVGQNPEKNW